MTPLKLIALDAEDLAVISAHVQDAVLKVAEIQYLPRERRLLVTMNRFNWETAENGGRGSDYERRRSILHFDQVTRVRHKNIKADLPDTVLNLLAVEFTEKDAPSGMVTLVFSGDGAVQLDVECIEARLADIGGAWETRKRPTHDIEAPAKG